MIGDSTDDEDGGVAHWHQEAPTGQLRPITEDRMGFATTTLSEEEPEGAKPNAKVGSLIARVYEISRVLGKGSAGSVFEALDLRVGRSVAVKLLHDRLANSPLQMQRFEAEAKLASSLAHPNIVRLLDWGVDSVPFHVFEFLEGCDLGEALDERALTVSESVTIARQILSGLHVVHEAGFVHRDIKPENVYLSQQDGETNVKLLDFGIAKALDPSTVPFMTMDNVMLGTPHYMSPEQILGDEITPATDLWAVGVLLFTMLAGECPFDADRLDLLLIKITQEKAPSIRHFRPELPAQLVDTIDIALSRDSKKRFASAHHMALALSSLS